MPFSLFFVFYGILVPIGFFGNDALTWLRTGKWDPLLVWHVFGWPLFETTITWVGIKRLVDGALTFDMSFASLIAWCVLGWLFTLERKG